MTDKDNFMGDAVFVDCVDPESPQTCHAYAQMGIPILVYTYIMIQWLCLQCENQDPRPGNGCKIEF